MYFEQALSLMREGHIISRGIPGERFRLYEGHFEIISEEYPDGCHTNVPGDDLSSDRWELADEKENNYSHDGYVKVLYNTYKQHPTISMNTKCYIKKPLPYFRWLVKESGDKVLQQAYNITTDTLGPEEIEWHDVETVFEKDMK